ncbi:hypothetical protein T492DRAFT_962709 [Pavlovales sp. CCMP2436]|nr:hypothetical protein T492DRAFT_962709 [Pavlovales sp. CCMP2436]|mmetsp:Transcript_40488/g.99978  ORF Transcript_40488/g.99978 Transcript_40488/m.99978 type:complete len:149 (-) Transcript_40488:113-559(-)
MAGAATKAGELRAIFKGAAEGDPDAQRRLGERYEHGDGVAQDQAEALRLYTLAADQGNSLAQCFLGVGTVYPLAHSLLALAAAPQMRAPPPPARAAVPPLPPVPPPAAPAAGRGEAAPPVNDTLAEHKKRQLEDALEHAVAKRRGRGV